MNLRNPFGYRRGPFSTVIVNAGWLTGARLAAELCSFVLFVLLSRRFGPSGIGKYAYGMTVGLLVYTLFNLGIEEYGIREYSRRSREDRETFFGRLATVQFLVLLPIVAGFAVFLLLSNVDQEIVGTTLILTAHFVFMNISGTFFIPAYSQQAMAVPAFSLVAFRVGAIGTSLWLILAYDASLPVALLPLPVFGAVQALVSYRSASRRNGGVRFGIEWKEIKEMSGVAWPFAASSLLFFTIARVNLIIVSTMLGDEATGYYFTGLKFLETGSLPLNLLGIAAYPILSRSFEKKGGEFVASAEKLMRMNLIAGGLLVWALFFFIPMVLAPVLGSKFVAATPLVKALALLALPAAIEAASIRIFFAMNLQAKRLGIQAVVAFLSIAVTVALIPSLGVIGAVVSSALAKLLLIGMYLFALRRETVYRSLRKPLGSFAIIFTSAICISGFLFWKTRLEWLPAAAFLVTFVTAIFCTGFLPIYKIGQRNEATSP